MPNNVDSKKLSSQIGFWTEQSSHSKYQSKSLLKLQRTFYWVIIISFVIQSIPQHFQSEELILLLLTNKNYHPDILISLTSILLLWFIRNSMNDTILFSAILNENWSKTFPSNGKFSSAFCFSNAFTMLAHVSQRKFFSSNCVKFAVECNWKSKSSQNL